MQACQDRRATFTPLCVSVNGMLGSEAEFFVRRVGDILASCEMGEALSVELSFLYMEDEM